MENKLAQEIIDIMKKKGEKNKQKLLLAKTQRIWFMFDKYKEIVLTFNKSSLYLALFINGDIRKKVEKFLNKKGKKYKIIPHIGIYENKLYLREYQDKPDYWFY